MKEFNKKYFNDGNWKLKKSDEHFHKLKFGTANAYLNTTDGYCKKTIGICELCGESFIVEKETNQNHIFESKGITPVLNPDTLMSEAKEKFVCGICGIVEYRDVD